MATAALTVIPTPQYWGKTGRGQKTYLRSRTYTIGLVGDPTARLCFAGEFLKKNLRIQYGLDFVIGEGGEADIVIVLDKAIPQLDQHRVFFAEENAREQGYTIEIGPEVALRAPSDRGCLYAVATLIQLFRPHEAEVQLDHTSIRDRPEFRYRGIRWLIEVEVGVWAYDRGDGPEAYRQRIQEKLDMALAYKINAVLFDGFGWGTDTHPDYAGLMRDLNRQARLRGIHLIHGGYGAGHAGVFRHKSHLYRGQILENRTSYPDGPVYHCIAGENYCATCLSNELLMELRLAELRRFVSAVEPGGLYVHQQDEGLSGANWLMRCPACRERWPSDVLAAENGMAGAYAFFYDAIVEAVKGVEKPGYNARRDCLVTFVSPGYLGHSVDDEGWQQGLEYWSTLSRLMKHRDGVYPLFRELFYDHQGNKPRAPQMRAALRRNDMGFGIIHFYGADGHHNDKLFLANPALNYVFQGTDMLLSASGQAYQEPLQLLDAEYMWNPRQSRFFAIGKKPSGYDEFKKLYYQCQYGLFKPPELYGEGGFLQVACAKLYGSAAGPVMAKVFNTCGTNGEPPVPYLKNSALLRGEMRGAEDRGGTREGGIFEHFTWPTNPSPALAGKVATRVGQSLQATREAAGLLKKLLANGTLEIESSEELNWYYQSLNSGVQYLGYLDEYLKIYQAVKNSTSGEESAGAQTRIYLLLGVIERARAHIRSSGLNPIDHLGGALAGREAILDFVEENLVEMVTVVEAKQ